LRVRETESLATGAAVAIVGLGALATAGELLTAFGIRFFEASDGPRGA
jgi:hypothetical protein